MMFVSVSGFSGLSQSSSTDGGATFRDLNIDCDFPVSQEILVAINWSYAVFAARNELLIRSFFNWPTADTRITAAAEIRQISASDRFCLVLLQNGALYKLIVGDTIELREVKFCTLSVAAKPSGVRRHLTEPVLRHIACGDTIAIAINSANEVFNIPSKVYDFPKHVKVKHLQCGFEHALVLSGNGELYSWGNGSRGQLGHDNLMIEERPRLIEALAGLKIVDMAAAGWHCAAISAFGDLYTWGYNSHGQLGLPLPGSSSADSSDQSVFLLPQLIDLPVCCPAANVENETDTLSKCSPLHVCAGARHTIVRMSCGSLFASGWNAYGQLGLLSRAESGTSLKDFRDSFEKIPHTVASDVDVDCGHWCTILTRKA